MRVQCSDVCGRSTFQRNAANLSYTGAMILAKQIFGSGRPLVVLPTAGLDGSVMALVFEPLFEDQESGVWQRIYLDLPGTGLSPAGEPYADAIVGYIQETISDCVSDSPFALLGWSYGAYLGAGLIRRWPDRVAGFFSICGGVRIALEHRDLSGVMETAADDDWLRGVDEQHHASLEYALGMKHSAVAVRVAELMAKNRPTNDHYFQELHAKGYALSDEEDRHTYSGPTSIVVGRSDRIAGFKDQFTMIDRFPDAQYAALPGVGHFVPVEAPAQFRETLHAWLARIS
jgi:pimeloyl-ACP methyl ester carboxylesterase